MSGTKRQRQRGLIFILVFVSVLGCLLGVFSYPAVAQAAQTTNVTVSIPSDNSPNASTGNPIQAALGDGGAKTAEANAKAELDALPTQTIDGYWQALQSQYGGYLPNISGQSLVRTVFAGGFHVRSMMHGLLRYFFAEVLDNAQLLGAILVLAVLAAVLESMQSAFEQQAVSQVAYAIIFLVMLVLAVGSFTEAIAYGRHAIQSMSDFMLAAIPIMTALLAGSGALASAAFYHPLLLLSVHFITNIVFMFVFPLIFFGAVLDITSALSPRYKVTRLAGLLRTVGVGTLGFCLSAFIGITAIQGAGKGVMDGVALRTAKYGVKTFVPVFGSLFSDAFETVASASLLVKNAIGISGLVLLVCLALFPAIKILAISFVYGGGSALMQPLGETPLVACLGALSKSLMLVFLSVAAVGMMFFISICILLATANLAVVMG